ncbi:MAG: PAS domain-containing protein [Deltaproteobacteria bacterium]|nr:PAS domain-containing protein [Deltaproteobacteria bacterium]MBW2137975.1 PAS domain-containing protein [Deltaproteobacteria bacterium]
MEKTVIHNRDKDDGPNQGDLERLRLNLAIVGGGRACKYFLEFLQRESFPELIIKIVGVYDSDPKAEGLVVARDMGIYTTNNLDDLFKVDNLDCILALTERQNILLDLFHRRPKGVGVMEYNLGRLIGRLIEMYQRMKSAEHQASLARMATHFLIQQTNERIVVLNSDFTIVEANEAYSKAVNRTKGDIIGMHCYETTHGLPIPCQQSHPELGCPMIETLSTGESAHVIHEHPRSEGGFRYCDMVTYPVKNQDGEIVQVIEIWRDITDELSSRWDRRVKEIKEDLQKLIQEDRMISLGKLVASCVHEINNPIQGLLTFTHLMLNTLQESELNEDNRTKFKDFLTLMANELERCGDIISGLLSFSRERTLEYKNIDINEAIKSVIALTRHRMEIQNIQLTADISGHALMVKGDLNQIQQCLLNLIFNAIEAMPRGGELKVTSRLENNKAYIEIKDTGCGIPEEHLKNIFDPFFTTKGEGEGTGLGLSIVYGVMKLHGGEVTVSSEISKGSTFVLAFPLVENISKTPLPGTPHLDGESNG